MTEQHCKNCNRLLFVECNGIKSIKIKDIEYSIDGYITVICKCKQINKF